MQTGDEIVRKYRIAPNGVFPKDCPEMVQNMEGPHKVLKAFQETYGFYDVFVISKNAGFVYATAFREPDFGANLSSGELKDSGLAECWRETLKKGDVYLTDFAPYAPSKGAQAQVIGYPLKVDGEVKGVLALQSSTELLDKVMQDQTGLGSSTGLSALDSAQGEGYSFEMVFQSNSTLTTPI